MAAGTAAALAQPPFGLLAGLLGFGAILWLCDRAAPERPVRSAFLRGLLAGSAYFCVSVWWIGEAFMVDAKDQAWMAPFAVAAVALGLGAFWGAAAALYRWTAPAGAWRLLTFAGAFAAAEWLRGHLLTGFPWDLPGETWRAGSAPSQAASLVGAYGLTWVTVAIGAAPGLGWRMRGARIAIASALAGLAALYGYGWAHLDSAKATPAADAPVVRIVQPDTPELPSYDAAAFGEILGRNLALTRRTAARPPAVVIWSEEGVPAALGDYLAPGTWTLAAVEASLSPGQTLITGGYRASPARPGEYAPDGFIYHNSLLALRRTAGGAEITALYDKHRLVPFGEFLPLEQLLAPLGVKQLIHVGAGFAPGPPTRALAPAGLPAFLPLICYESLFPGLSRDAVALGNPAPRWIVNISDDAWFGPTIGPLQHLNLASYRSIETGLPMVRATPTGVSAIIDAYGRPLPGKVLGEGGFGLIDSPLPPSVSPTLFDSWGEATFAGMLMISLITTVLARRATLRRNSKARW